MIVGTGVNNLHSKISRYRSTNKAVSWYLDSLNMYLVDLNVMPKHKSGAYDWIHSVGLTVPFTKDTVPYSFKIIGFNETSIIVEFMGEKRKLMKQKLKDQNLNSLFKKPFYEIGDTVNFKTGKVEVTNISYKNFKSKKTKYYDARCSTCGTISSYKSSRFKPNRNCPVCINKKTVYGVNSLEDIFPEIANLLLDKDLAKSINSHSDKHFDFICPGCGKTLNKSLRYVVRYGLFCNNCGHGYKGIHYPQLLVTNVIKNLPIEVAIEQSFPWTLNKKTKHFRRYDIYLPSENTIIEINGLQHYEDNVFTNTPLLYVLKNDTIKRLLAFKNGIENFTYVDTSVSTLNFIKTSVCSNQLIQALFKKYNIDLYDDMLWKNAEDLTKQQLHTNQNVVHLIELEKFNQNDKQKFELTTKQIKALHHLQFVSEELNSNVDAFFHSDHSKNSELWNYLFNFDNNTNTINDILKNAGLPTIHYIENLNPLEIPFDADVYELGKDYDECYNKCELALDRIVSAIDSYLSTINILY